MHDAVFTCFFLLLINLSLLTHSCADALIIENQPQSTPQGCTEKFFWNHECTPRLLKSICKIDSHGRVVRHTAYHYDESNLLRSITVTKYPRFNQDDSLQISVSGDLLPLAAATTLIEELFYDSSDERRLIMKVDSTGKTTTYLYDEAGNLRLKKVALNAMYAHPDVPSEAPANNNTAPPETAPANGNDAETFNNASESSQEGSPNNALVDEIVNDVVDDLINHLDR